MGTCQKKNWSTIFSKFGTITIVDFILLDPDTLERENFCFSEFVCCQKATSGEQHKVGQRYFTVSLTCKSSAVKITSEIIVCSLPHVSINLLVVYRESVNLIGYITRRLSADSQQL